MLEFRTKRIYLPAEAGDGVRILIDRLWPRGIRKADAAIDHWLRDFAPSDDLRKWYQHDSAKWLAFQKRYEAELDQNQAQILRFLNEIQEELAPDSSRAIVSIIYASREETMNNATCFAAYCRSLLR